MLNFVKTRLRRSHSDVAHGGYKELAGRVRRKHSHDQPSVTSYSPQSRDHHFPVNVHKSGNSHDINQNTHASCNHAFNGSVANLSMDRSKGRHHSGSSSVSSSNILLDDIVEMESLSDPFDPEPEPRADPQDHHDWRENRASYGSPARREAATNNGFSNSFESLDSDVMPHATNTSSFDIVGQTSEVRFPWQHDVGVQCSIMRWVPRRVTSLDIPDHVYNSEPEKSDFSRNDGFRTPTRISDKVYSRQSSREQIHVAEDVGGRSGRRDGIIPTITHDSPTRAGHWGRKHPEYGVTVPPDSPKKSASRGRRNKDRMGQHQRASSVKNRSKPSITRTASAGNPVRRMHSTDDSLSLDCWPSSGSDIGDRTDTLTSPRVSPVPWLAQAVPELVVTSMRGESGHKNKIPTGGSKKDNFLAVPPRRFERLKSQGANIALHHGHASTKPRPSERRIEPLRRKSSGSLHSASDDSDSEGTPTVPPATRRGRRQAICDSKSLGLNADGDLSPSNSCDESEGNSAPPDRTYKRSRKRSSGDLGINYPGDLLVHGRQKKVLIKRNTIADFANTKAYQGSIASLISEKDSKKKPTSSFSLIKLIQDKKGHRAKEVVTSIGEILSHLKRSEFKDNNLMCYKDSHWSELIASQDKDGGSLPMLDHERKRREAVWELFISECVFLIDHLMVLKHCFMEPLKKVQVEGCLMFAEPQDLFGNLDELCYVSYTFCRDFISVLLKDASSTDFGRTEVLVMALQQFSQLTRDGEVYHDYCLNYSKAVTYLEQLRKNEDFTEFEKWCESDARCHRLQLTDLLISPMQHCTKVPLLLTNIRKYTTDIEERKQLTEALEKLDSSLKSLESKMKWLKNFERVQEIQQQIMWQPISELDPRAFIPEFLKSNLMKQPCERLLASPKRQLLHEGPLTLLEINKTIDMYMLLFDDILLLTRIKKPPRKKSNTIQDNPLSSPRVQTDGAVFVVHRQPIALDRFTIHDVRPPDAAGLWWEYLECGVHLMLSCDSAHYAKGTFPYLLHHGSTSTTDSFVAPSIEEAALLGMTQEQETSRSSNLLFGCLSAATGLKNAFVLVQISRFQQIIGVYTLQAPSESAKAAWLTRLHDAQKQYKAALRRTDSVCSSTVSFDTTSLNVDDTSSEKSSSIGRAAPLNKSASVDIKSRADSISKDCPEKDFSNGKDHTSDRTSLLSNGPETDNSMTEHLLAQNFQSLNIESLLGDSKLSAIPTNSMQSTPLSVGSRSNSLHESDKTDTSSLLSMEDSSNQTPVSTNGAEVSPPVMLPADNMIPILPPPPATPDTRQLNGDGGGPSAVNSSPQTNRSPMTLSRMQKLNLLKVIHEKSKESLDMFDPVYI